MEKNREIFQRLPFWEKLTEEQKAYAIQHGSVRHYGKDSLIYDGGSVCLGMACVLKGSIRVSLLSEEGREITLFRLEQGEPCVLSASCVKIGRAHV